MPLLHPGRALILAAPQDGRYFFILPWNGNSLIGTTDTPYEGKLEDVSVTENDVHYLLEAASFYLPKWHLEPSSVISSFAGVRPLVMRKNVPASSISRKHLLHVSSSGLINILGGKYTIYRRMAEETVDLITSTPCKTASSPLYAENYSEEEMRQRMEKMKLPLPLREHLLANYGPGTMAILTIVERSPEEGKQICPLHPHIFAELTYAIENEYVVKPEDWFERRTSIAYTPCRGKSCAEVVADKIKSYKHRIDQLQTL